MPAGRHDDMAAHNSQQAEPAKRERRRGDEPRLRQAQAIRQSRRARRRNDCEQDGPPRQTRLSAIGGFGSALPAALLSDASGGSAGAVWVLNAVGEAIE
jgi:hypothetical protein